MRRRGWAWFLALGVFAPASACGLLSDIADPQLVGSDSSADSAVDETAIDAQDAIRTDLGPEVDASRDSAFDVGDSPSPDTRPDVADADAPADARDGDGGAIDSMETSASDADAGEATPIDAATDTADDASSDAPDTSVADADTAEACVPATTSCPASYCGTITDECGNAVPCPVLCPGDLACVAHACTCTATSCPGSCASGRCASAKSVAIGAAHTCALLSDATVRCWGYNADGELGLGTTFAVTRPQSPLSLTGSVRQLTASRADCRDVFGGGRDCYSHTCALMTDGTVECWGSNLAGQLGDGTTVDRWTPTSVPGLSSMAAIGAGKVHTCALGADGAVRCWGGNPSGQLGDGTTTSTSSPKVIGLDGVGSIAVGANHVCAVMASDFSVKCWGDNYHGQLGNGSTSSSSTPVTISSTRRFVRIAAGGLSTCGLSTDGTVLCWGYAPSLGTGAAVDSPVPVVVPGLSGIVDIYAGYAHTCAKQVPGDGVFCWGANDSGQLGTGSSTGVTGVVSVSGLAGVLNLAAGSGHTCATTGDGSALGEGALQCWGSNAYGQLGDGSATDRLSPTSVVW